MVSLSLFVMLIRISPWYILSFMLAVAQEINVKFSANVQVNLLSGHWAAGDHIIQKVQISYCMLECWQRQDETPVYYLKRSSTDYAIEFVIDKLSD